jgi:hypothetical protein
MTVRASERDAKRIEEMMSLPGVPATLWAEFVDAIVIEDRAPVPREIRDNMGPWRRILAWRPKPIEAPRFLRTPDLATGDVGCAAGAAYVVTTVAAGVACIVAQMYGVFGWLVLAYAVYLVGALVVHWGMRRVRIDAPWKVWLTVALPLPLVALIGFVVRGMIHPAFAWSNAELFFSR